jgi:hypothetical protein
MADTPTGIGPAARPNLTMGQGASRLAPLGTPPRQPDRRPAIPPGRR